MKKGNIFISVLFSLIGVYVLIEANTFPNAGGDGMTGPEFFPNILAFILIGLSILLFISTLLNREDKEIGLFDTYAVKAYVTMAALVVYMILLNTVGFIIATPLFLFGLIRFYGMKHYPKIVLTSVLVTASIYGVFKLLLAVPLPTGILG